VPVGASGTWLYGYRPIDAGLQLLGEWDDSVKVFIEKPVTSSSRRPQARQMAPRIRGIIPFTPDKEDLATVVCGGNKRIWAKLETKYDRGLRPFVHAFAVANWKPIPGGKLQEDPI